MKWEVDEIKVDEMLSIQSGEKPKQWANGPGDDSWAIMYGSLIFYG